MKEKLTKENVKKVLEEFISMPIDSSNNVLEKFSLLPNAIYHNDGSKKNFVYIEGTREDKVLLVAHTDTVWDKYYEELDDCTQSIYEKNGVYYGTNPEFGIGADDRAGCAILWLLKDMGHSLLIVDGEEYGQIGSKHIKRNYPDIYDKINNHSYIIQFDRRNGKDYKVYNLPVSQEFIDFIENNTKYEDAGRFASTDIVVLCNEICGVNLSIGYYNEHHSDEHLVFDEWYNTLIIAYELLLKKQSKYPLNK